MKSVIVLGSGRGGTSLAAGTLAKAGYFMGNSLHKPRESNPKGFFEDGEINEVNESILAGTIPGSMDGAPTEGQRWLARVPLESEIFSDVKIEERIEWFTSQRPFCYKDPRFCYTLPVWRPFLKDTVFLCVFRHPAITAMSIVKECADRPYLKSLPMDFEIALDVWTLMFRHILDLHRREGQWLFMHYDQFMEEEGLGRLESFTGAKVDYSFPDTSLAVAKSEKQVSPSAAGVYGELSALAGY